MDTPLTTVAPDRWEIFVEAVGIACPSEECDGWMEDPYGSSMIGVDEPIIRCNTCGLEAETPPLSQITVRIWSLSKDSSTETRRKLGARKLTLLP